MRIWNRRPIEVRNLFNPAFCGLVMHRALATFQEFDSRGMPFSLSLLILPLSLQKQSREILHRGNRSYFLKLVGEFPELQVGFGRRCTDLLPFTFEALATLASVGVLEVKEGGRLTVSLERVRKTVGGTNESQSAQKVAIYLGKEFAKVGHSSTIYTTLGVRP